MAMNNSASLKTEQAQPQGWSGQLISNWKMIYCICNMCWRVKSTMNE